MHLSSIRWSITFKQVLATILVVAVLVSCQEVQQPAFQGIAGTVVDSSGQPVSAATVVLSSNVDATIEAHSSMSTQTDSSGTYSFELVGAGTFSIAVSTNDGRGNFRADISYLGEGLLTINLEVTPVGAISGTAVVDSQPTDSGGIDVYVPGTSYIAKTRDDGAFVISAIPAGTYDLAAQLAGFPRVTVSGVTVVSGQTTALSTPIVLGGGDPGAPDPDEPDPPEDAKGRVSGNLFVGSESSMVGVPLRAVGSGAPLPYDAMGDSDKADRFEPEFDDAVQDFVPGEIVVRYVDDGLQAAAMSMFDVAGVSFRLERSLAAEGLRLYQAVGLDRAGTLAAARALNARSDVLYAFPNYIYRAAAVPDDTFYARQWHYDAINMESAWDITTGSSDVVVAVLDSGIIDSHPDFAGRLLPGYDFISDVTSANDGGGRDGDPYDDVNDGSGYHGTHVAGTIGAATDNGVGVAGVDWSAMILPVRVLGASGGTFVDITDALIWAVGGSVSGVPANSNPADVINLSLGGSSTCSQPWQDVIDTVSAFAVVVAAAGNDNVSANGFVPANCSGVIAVGATDYQGERSYYSNFGSAVDVMAPGGDLTASFFDGARPDGVLSVGFDGSPDYVFMQGTSMAAPHVSGVVALMRALDPGVDADRALAALRASAKALSDSACDGPGAGRELFSEDCGAGMIDAALALAYIDSGVVPPPNNGVLTFSPGNLDLGQTAEEATYTITNVSGATIDWSLTTFEYAPDTPAGSIPSGAVLTSNASGSLADGASESLTLFLERELLIVEGYYRFWLRFEVTGEPDQLYEVTFAHSEPSAPQLSGPMLVAAYQEDDFGDLVTTGLQQSAGVLASFDFDVDPGSTLLGAWSDENDDGLVNDGDFFGFRDSFVNVASGQHVSGLDIRLEQVFGSPSGVDPAFVKRLEALQEGL